MRQYNNLLSIEWYRRQKWISFKCSPTALTLCKGNECFLRRKIDLKKTREIKKFTNSTCKDKNNLTSAAHPFIKIRQSVQPISVTLLQTGLTFHSRKIGDELFGLLVIAAAVNWPYVCQSTNLTISLLSDCSASLLHPFSSQRSLMKKQQLLVQNKLVSVYAVSRKLF